MITKSLLPFLLLVAPAAALAQPITEQDLSRHIDILASDAFEGREPGTAGEKKTTDYIAEQWRAAGLEPAAEGGSWLQPVPLVTRTPLTQRASWIGRGRTFGQDQSQLLLFGRSAAERIERAAVVLAVGDAGLEASDVEGAVVVIPYQAAGAAPFDERLEALARMGAAGVVGVMPRTIPWRVTQAMFGGERTALSTAEAPPITGLMSHQAAERLFGRFGKAADPLLAGVHWFEPRRVKLTASLEAGTEVRRFSSSNVLGRIRGSGAGGEAILFLGHWDHLGRCGAEGEADRICNGAVDNASGIAALIEIARRLARGPRPKRDILFLATTAEESGLLGAEHFAAKPPVPLGSIVAALNLDTIAIAPRGERVAVLGRGHAPLDRAIAEAVAEAGREQDHDGEADSFVQRQDGWALARAGVPAVMVGGSFSDMAKLQAFIGGAYHGASDNPDAELILGGAAEDADLMVLLARRLADPALYRH